MPHLPRTVTLYLRLACAVAALAAAYACDARTPTDPALALTPVPLRGSESGDAELGSISLTPTGSYSQFATIPEFAWALVRVSGKWIVESNPACAGQPPNWPCSSLAPYSGYDLEYPDAFRGPVRLATISPTGSFDFLELRGSGGPDEGIGLTQREFSRDVLASPALLNPSVQQFGTTGPSVSSYIIDGSYMVTVTRIASPIRVTEGAAEADGSRTYTVEPLYGLKFINPLGSFDPPGAVRWFFVPGEDVDPVAPNSDPPWRIYECSNLTSCRWTPPGPGRVQVSASVETRRARARSGGAAPDTPQEPKLVLRCDGKAETDTVTRGNRMECTASPEPAGATVTDVRWEFRDDSGHVITGPSGELGWGGIMVVGGQIKVSGTVNGKQQAPTMTIVIKPRDWTGQIVFPPEPKWDTTSGPPLRYPPIIEGDTLADGTLGQAGWPRPEPASGYGEGTGPNDGWFFFDKPPYFSPNESHIWINIALTPTDPFWRAQRGPPPGRVVFGKPACGPEFMRHAARHIATHEHGHYAQAEALAKSPQGAALLESAIRWGDPVSEAEQDELIQNWLRADRAQVAHWDSVSILHVPCDFTRP